MSKAKDEYNERMNALAKKTVDELEAELKTLVNEFSEFIRSKPNNDNVKFIVLVDMVGCVLNEHPSYQFVTDQLMMIKLQIMNCVANERIPKTN